MNRFFKQTVLLFSLLTIAAAAPSDKKPLTLSSHEEEIARRIGFDREIFLLIKDETQDCCIHRLTGYDADGYQIMVDGVTASVPQDKDEQILIQLRTRLHKKGYMAFIIETNAGIKLSKIGVLKGSDQYDILRVMQTNGEDDDIANEDIIAELKEWEKCCPFDILGAENGWVELEFKKLPDNIKSFVENLEDFCPDAVDDGGASAEDELAKEIQKTKRLFLWWE